MKKIIKYTIFLLFLLICILLSFYYINKNNEQVSNTIKKILPSDLKIYVRQIINTLNITELKKNNDFLSTRVAFLQNKIIELSQQKKIVNNEIFPQTQFLELEYHEVSLDNFILNNIDIKNKLKSYETKRDGNNVYSFYLESLDDKIIILDSYGNSYYSNFDHPNEFNYIENNLPDQIHVTDTLIINDNLFIAFSKKDEHCDNFEIYYSVLKYNRLEFKKLLDFFNPNSKLTCGMPHGGRMEYDINNNDLYFSHSEISDNFNQNKNDYTYKYAKITKINLDTKNVETISTGHRNPQGLLITSQNYILSTEHGPRGGDEINNIVINKNYGWPIASYGEPYGEGYKESEEYTFKKNHNENSYIEPIFAFVPSIGISQIIELNNDFSKKWRNNFILSSLRSQSLYRIKFDKKFNKILYYEKINIGKRIRDLNYNVKNKTILLALEKENGFIGFIKNKNN